MAPKNVTEESFHQDVLRSDKPVLPPRPRSCPMPRTDGQAGSRDDAGDDRERDRLGDQSQGDDQSRQDLGAPDLRIGDPMGPQAAQARRGDSSGSRRRPRS